MAPLVIWRNVLMCLAYAMWWAFDERFFRGGSEHMGFSRGRFSHGHGNVPIAREPFPWRLNGVTWGRVVFLAIGPGEFLFISVWAIRLTSCFVYRFRVFVAANAGAGAGGCGGGAGFDEHDAAVGRGVGVRDDGGADDGVGVGRRRDDRGGCGVGR